MTRLGRCARALLGVMVGLMPWVAAAESPPVDEDYVLHCSACHGSDGAGVGGVVPGLGAVGEIATRPGGRDYLMRVPGAAQAPLDDARLARLLNWVVATYGGVEVVPPITREEVGAARVKPLRDPAAVRSVILAKPDARR